MIKGLTKTVSIICCSLFIAATQMVAFSPPIKLSCRETGPIVSPTGRCISSKSTIAQKRMDVETIKRYAFQEHTTILLINKFYQTWPVTSSILTCGIKASAADLLAQLKNASSDRRISTKTELHGQTLAASTDNHDFRFEYARNLAFLLYGAMYQGLFQYQLYNVWFPAWFGSSTDLATVTAMVAFDTFWITPLICWPLAYLTKSITSGSSARSGLKKYIHDLKSTGLVRYFFAIWVPIKVRFLFDNNYSFNICSLRCIVYLNLLHWIFFSSSNVFKVYCLYNGS